MARTETTLFLTDDFMQRLSALYVEIDEATRKRDKEGDTPQTALDADPIEALAAEHAALKAEAEQAARDARLYVEQRSITRREWRAMKQDHPPRTEGHEDDVKADRLAGANTDTVENDLVRASLVEPTFEDRASFDEWADSLSEGEWGTLVQVAWRLHSEARFNPKDAPTSQTRSTATK